MNYKLLFPTYRTRFLFVEESLNKLLQGRVVARGLNLGCGEGDYDLAIKQHCRELDACDINEADVAYARQLNSDEPAIHYSAQDGTRLDYADAAFDIVTCIDVIEHVADRESLVHEISRVLKPGGFAIVSGPSHHFPVTYDPINLILRRFGQRMPMGAYGYGHTILMQEDVLAAWLEKAGLRVMSRHYLTKALAALTELYWPSVVQRVFKANADNRSEGATKRYALKPSREAPGLVRFTDLIIHADERLFSQSRRSVGIGFLTQRPSDVRASIPPQTAAG